MDQSHYTQEMIDCYSQQAEQFHHTRKKYRPELDAIKQHIDPHTPSRILELGCGSGRPFPHLKEHMQSDLIYTGVDNAPGMIEQARAEYGEDSTNTHRVVDDMISYMEKQADESVDYIISLASLQHLMSQEQRHIYMTHCYRILSYGGKHITINRAYSEWFLKKYRKQQTIALLKSLIPGNGRHRNDLVIPRTSAQDNTKTWQRYYHIFTLYEIEQLHKQHGFIIQQAENLSGKNTFIVGEKAIFLDK